MEKERLFGKDFSEEHLLKQSNLGLDLGNLDLCDIVEHLLYTT